MADARRFRFSTTAAALVAAAVLVALTTNCAAAPRRTPSGTTGDAAPEREGVDLDPTGTVARVPIPAPPPSIDGPTERFLDDVERRTFRWFWDTAHPTTRLIPDRWPTRTFASVAAVGFGLTAYAIGAERGYVTRRAARDRTLQTLRFLYELPQGPDATGVAGYRGFFYHFLDLHTGLRFQTVELSTIDTALLTAGVLTARDYFDRADPAETEIRTVADALYQRVEWDWAQTP